jgi:hypothetical protein
MRSAKVALLLIAFVVVHRAAVAQGTGHPPPSPCSDRICSDQAVVGGAVPSSLQSPPATDAGAYVTVSDEVLRVMGISRVEFVDRVSSGFFPGVQVDLLFSTTEMADPESSPLERLRLVTSDPSDPPVGAVALEIRRIYLIPRSGVRADWFDRTDELVVTDGQTWVTIRFRESPATLGRALSVR